MPELLAAAEPVDWAQLLAALPAPRPMRDARKSIARSLVERNTRLLVIDDDPTGSQSVRDVTVLTRWEDEDLRYALGPEGSHVTFVLTNTRALDSAEAQRINYEIGGRAAALADELHVDVRFVSRSDSTLRGHFPAETNALIDGSGEVDGILLCPAFLGPGRVTVGDVHWVREGDVAVPAAATEFARDATFGYTSSRLQDWVAERDPARGAAATSISIEDLRLGGAERVEQLLRAVSDRQVIVANVADESDLDVLVLGLLGAEAHGKHYVYRTAPSFVAARCGQTTGTTLSVSEIYAAPRAGHGLIVVGSHAALTTRQLAAATARFDLAQVELDVDVLLSSGREAEIERARMLVESLMPMKHVVLSTSRIVRTDATAAASLALSRRISDAVVELVAGLDERLPLRFLIAKGGITSSDIATRALDVRRATVLGQLFPGQVSVWRLEQRDRLPYVVFPGNVGSDESLADTLAILLEDN